jgi:hypothetical protein
VSLVKGEAEVFPRPEKSFDPTRIPKALEDSGFTASEVVVTVEGVLVRGRDSLELRVPGLTHSFALEGGAMAGALEGRADLLERKIRLVGNVQPARGERPPALSVEEVSP